MSEQKRVLVCGSRDWHNVVGGGVILHDRIAALSSDVTVIHGDAKGADKLAAYEARERGLRVEAFPADWRVKPDTPPERIRSHPNGTKYDAGAGNDRNLQMLDTEPDLVIAFTENLNESKGTKHTVTEARKRGIPVEVHSTQDIVRFTKAAA